MKKTITVLVATLIFVISNICFAETSKIIYEENSTNSLTYTVCETTASPFGRLGKAFSKHVDTNGNTHYWIRLALGGENNLYYQMILNIDGVDYILPQEEQPTKYQITSTTRMIMFSTRAGAINYYRVSPEIIAKIQNANKIVMKYRTQQSDEKEKEWNDSMIEKTKQIINMQYTDKENFSQG